MSRFIVCAGGRALDLASADRGAVRNLERVQDRPGELANFGVDTHFAARTAAGPGRFSAIWDATYTVGYDTRALLLEGTNFTLHPAGHHAGYLNFAHPIAVRLPRWKSRWSASYAWNVYTLASYSELHLRV